MKKILINNDWTFYPGKFDLFHYKNPESEGYRKINLPHDFMIETDVSPDSESGAAMGFYKGGIASYTKELFIPYEYEHERVYLYFDGVMGHASLDVNGSFVMNHHYGYTPFYADITDYLDYGKNNKLTLNVNASMQPSSRWYTGAGIYREVSLVHGPLIHIENDGIYCHTDRIYNGKAFTVTEVAVRNHTDKRRIVEVSVSFTPKNDANAEAVTRKTRISIDAGQISKARIQATINNPLLWDANNPNLYNVCVETKEIGVFTTHLIPSPEPLCDSSKTTFGIRTISVDSTNGLLINNQPIKLKGGCVHHDNGIIGAVSVYDAEYKKLKAHKDNGFNAVRSAHNPPSKAWLDVCDELGLYVIDEAFDCFEQSKQPGDYGQFFEYLWEKDMASFIKRDRNHPSIIIWSTGNEITERGGLGHGFSLATALSDYVRTLDTTRPVTNAFCDFWGGLCDDEQCDNPKDKDALFLEQRSEPFVGNLDLVGYNYLDEHYAQTARNYPERVIVGTESVPKFIDTIWANVMAHNNVIGDFTWTSYDYIGEAGLGKSCFYDKSSEEEKKHAEYMLGTWQSPFPWRLAKDADFDINGIMQPQGYYRKVVWGNNGTYLFSSDPKTYNLGENISFWGFDYIYPQWNYSGFEGSPVKVHVFSRAPYVELYLNKTLVGKMENGADTHYKAIFDVQYEPGELLAISYDNNGREISRGMLYTTKAPKRIKLTADKTTLLADGLSMAFVKCEIIDEDGNSVYNAEVPMKAEIICNNPESGDVITDCAQLQGFGSGNPITDENYSRGSFKTYHGMCMAAIRSGYQKGTATLKISAPEYETAVLEIAVV